MPNLVTAPASKLSKKLLMLCEKNFFQRNPRNKEISRILHGSLSASGMALYNLPENCNCQLYRQARLLRRLNRKNRQEGRSSEQMRINT